MRMALTELEEEYKRRSTNLIAGKLSAKIPSAETETEEERDEPSTILEGIQALSKEYLSLAEEWRRESTELVHKTIERLPFARAFLQARGGDFSSTQSKPYWYCAKSRVADIVRGHSLIQQKQQQFSTRVNSRAKGKFRRNTNNVSTVSVHQQKKRRCDIRPGVSEENMQRCSRTRPRR